MTRAAREAQLLDIAEEVLVERGTRKTTVEEIAERAGITKPVIYDHFGSKDGLIGKVISRAHAELEAATVQAYTEMDDPSDAKELLRVMLVAWFTFIDKHRGSYALLRADGALSRGKVERIRNNQAQLIAEAFRLTSDFADVSEERRVLMATLLNAVSERYAQWRLDQSDVTPEEAAAHVTAFAWGGLKPLAEMP